MLAKINFDGGNFVDNLGYMGKGMLGIMIVIGAIILVTVILNATTKKKDKKDK